MSMQDDYLQFCVEYAKGQKELEKTGKYNPAKVFYHDETKMIRYLNALWVSYDKWPHHIKMMGDFKQIINNLPNSAVYYDIPCGNGIYLKEVLSLKPNWKIKAYDLSETSVDYTKKVTGFKDVYPLDYRLITEPADIIFCGELLEHLEKPEELLTHLKKLLRPGGTLILTTAIFAYNPDHIYLFNTKVDVDLMLKKHFQVISSKAYPAVKNKSEDDSKTPMTYMAVLK